MWKSLKTIRCLLCLFILAASGCSLISLKKLDIACSPSEKDELVPAGERLWVRFPFLPDTAAAEKLFTVQGGPSLISFDYEWAEETLYLKPVPELMPGVRYVFSYEGIVASRGRKGLNVSISGEIPFFYGSSIGPPSLIKFSPDGDADTEEPLIMRFDRAMDPESIAASFSISPLTEYSFSLSESDTVLSIRPENGWVPKTFYTWELGKGALDAKGVPIQRDIKGSFRVQKDISKPKLIQWGPVRLIGSDYYPQPGFYEGDDLLLQFSEPVDRGALESAFSIDPDIGGDLIHSDRGVYIFRPEKPFAMGQTYYVTVGKELTDREGNFITDDIRFNFTTSVPVQEVREIRCIGSLLVTLQDDVFNTDQSSIITFNGPGPSYTQIIEIDFAEPYGEGERDRITNSISLYAYFPDSVISPYLEQAVWIGGGSTVRLLYSGFYKSSPPGSPEKKIYKLAVAGGEGNSRNGNGSYLKEDVVVFLEAERE